jgi:hypothetical protein
MKSLTIARPLSRRGFLAIPLDAHPFVQYYNTSVCRKAGLLDSSGQLPPITGAQPMLAAMWFSVSHA